MPDCIPYCILCNTKNATETYGYAELYGMDHGFRKRYYQEQHGLENRRAIPCTWNNAINVCFRSQRNRTSILDSHGIMYFGGNHQQQIQQLRLTLAAMVVVLSHYYGIKLLGLKEYGNRVFKTNAIYGPIESH